jgi:hypothetical protein
MRAAELSWIVLGRRRRLHADSPTQLANRERQERLVILLVK